MKYNIFFKYKMKNVFLFLELAKQQRPKVKYTILKKISTVHTPEKVCRLAVRSTNTIVLSQIFKLIRIHRFSTFLMKLFRHLSITATQ